MPTTQHAFRDLALPVVVAVLLFLPLIGERVLFISDEARYALIARNMVEAGHWLVPHIGDEVHMEKPPAFPWAIAGLSLLGGRGVTELASVLPAAVAGIGAVLVTVVFGRRLFGGTAGMVAGLVLATSFGFFTHARMALADMPITFCAVASLWAFWRGSMVLFYLFLALGLSLKGPYALMPILVVGLFLVGDGGWRRLRELRLGTGALVLAAAVSPWAIAFALQPRQSYFRDVVVGDFGVHFTFEHFTLWSSAREILFPLGPLGIEFLPWALLLPAAFVAGFRRAPDAETRRRMRLLLTWTLVYVVLVTLSSHKRDRYLLPVFPALALGVGWLVTAWQARGADRTVRRHAWLVAAAALVAALVLLAPPRLSYELDLWMPPSPWTALPAVAFLLAAGAALLALVRRGRVVHGVVAFTLGMALLLAYQTRVYVARHNAMHDVQAFARLLADRVPPGATLASFRYGRLSIDFYARRPALMLRQGEEVKALLDRGAPVYVFAEARGWQILETAGVGTWEKQGAVDLAGRSVILARSR